MSQVTNSEETAEQPNTKQNIVVLVLLAVLVLVLGALAFSYLSDKKVELNSRSINVLVADSSEERAQGLSGRKRLAENQGMLFVFTDPGQYCLWMKDMNFAIDMIWLDKDKKVIDIKENAQPESYPESFCPRSDAQYILEVPANSAQKWGVERGQVARF